MLDNSTVLIHGKSRVVLGLLTYAVSKNRPFSVMITSCQDQDPDAEFLASQLKSLGVPFEVVHFASVAHRMHQVDFVLFGAEAIVESGGVVNKMGTYQIAIVAKTLNKPVYVASESYKFARLFPLTQQDIPPAVRACCDYTPPEFITLLFTDLGILTPSAVSDELIKLYY